MTKQEKAYITGFVESDGMFVFIANYIGNIPDPEYSPTMSLADYGAMVLAHRTVMDKVRQKFIGLRIDAQAIEDYVQTTPD